MARWLAVPLMLVCAQSAWAANHSVTATGRCVYKDGTTIKPVPGAKVELRDQDFKVPVKLDVVGPVALSVSGNDVCASGTAGADGRFRLSGKCGDFGFSFIKATKPDLYVRCSLQGSAGRIFQNGFPWTLYNATSSIRRDSTSHNVGDVVLPTAPSKLFVTLRTTYNKVKSLAGTSLLPVWAVFPGGREVVILNTDQTYFASFAGTVFMSIAPGREDTPTVAHEYGHTLQFQSFLKDWTRIRSVYNVFRAAYQSIRHSTGAGHTFSTISNPVLAFAEGWAEFMAGVVFGRGLPDCSTWKEIGARESDRIQVEGNVACRLFRLFKKWGYRDIWKAQTSSKAVRYDHFFADYKKLHPTAASVALPTLAVARAPLLVAKPAAKPVAIAVAKPVLKRLVLPKIQLARVVVSRARAAGFATKRRLSKAVRRTLQRAEGAACRAIRDALGRQVSLLTAGCRKVKAGLDRTNCGRRVKALRARADGFKGFCVGARKATKAKPPKARRVAKRVRRRAKKAAAKKRRSRR